MYTKESKEYQFSFLHNNFFLKPEFDETHIMIKIANSLDWVSLSNKLSKFYSSSGGRPTKPSRVKVGLLILKHLYTLSDENVVDFLKRDIYAQYLCDISIKEEQTLKRQKAYYRYYSCCFTHCLSYRYQSAGESAQKSCQTSG